MDNKILITIDKNISLGYEEKDNLDLFRILLMRMLAFWVMAKKKILGSKTKFNTLWFDKLSSPARKVKEGATTWRALDIIYNYSPKKSYRMSDIITNFWNKTMNARALRNRLRLTKQKLHEILQEVAVREKNVRLFSIACGSAQGVIEVMKELKEKGIIVQAVLLDLDVTAIEYSKKLAMKAGIIDQITFINKSARFLEEAAKDFVPHVVEMVGFLEYRTDEKTVELLNKIYRILVPGGILITSHMAPNSESIFVKWVANWPIIYRSPNEFAEIIIKGGFAPKKCEIICEPLEIHGIAICRKSNLLT